MSEQRSGGDLVTPHEGQGFKVLGDDRVVWVDEPRLAALFHIAHCALSGLEGSEATEQAVDQNLATADALRAALIKWISTAQTPLVFDDAAGAESVHDAYDKGWSEAEAHFATTTAGEEWERAELWRSKANAMDSRLKLATAFVENAGPVVGNRAELLLILSGASTTSGSAAAEETDV